MNRIEAAFQKKPIFMPYYPLGYPDLPTSVDVMEALSKNGADLIEVGLSFSDPLADGPVIQKATQVALEGGITVRKSLQAVAELRRRGVEIPLVLMGYYNPILAYGLQAFIHDALAAGADGFIIPDLPPEEASEFTDLLVIHQPEVPLITMLAPTTPEERMSRLAKGAQGFIYLVSVTGVTGVRRDIASGIGELVARIQQFTKRPVCVGFGISTPQQAAEVSKYSDGVIVGSACVRQVGGSGNPAQAAAEFAARFQEAIVGASSL